MKKALAKTGRLFFTGFSMGTADLVPGVSGGTIAFIYGIYEELLQTIKVVSGVTLKLFFTGRFRQAFQSVPWGFLLPLFAGLFLAIFSLANLLSFLLTAYPAFVWAFFFGLVVSSIRIVVKRVKTWDLHDITLFLVAALGAYWLVGFSPVETGQSLWQFFWSGAVAICAMILPGISGSFILVLLGKYHQVLAAVTDFNFTILLVFALGAAFGLSFFARFLSWLFKKHHDLAVVALAGVMLGSLRKVWPWQEVTGASYINHLPSFNLHSLYILGFILLGILVMNYLDSLQLTREQSGDLQAGK